MVKDILTRKELIMSETTETVSGGGISFFGALTILFIGLKLGNVIDWSWVWVLSPLWIPFVLVIVFLLFLLIIVGIIALIDRF